MSIKAFHMFFVTVSTLLCGGLSVWSTIDFVQNNKPSALPMAIICGLLGIALLTYGKWFLKKMTRITA